MCYNYDRGMYMDDKKIMKIITKDGIEKDYTIICTFQLPSTGKNYLVYTDEKDNTNKTNVYVAIYYPGDDGRLDEITDKQEWNEVSRVVDSIIGGVISSDRVFDEHESRTID